MKKVLVLFAVIAFCLLSASADAKEKSNKKWVQESCQTRWINFSGTCCQNYDTMQKCEAVYGKFGERCVEIDLNELNKKLKNYKGTWPAC